MSCDARYAGRRPNDVEIGTQMKFENPRTRIATPVKRTTAAISLSKSSARYGNIGASASGPKPCVKETLVEAVMQSAFHMVDQFWQNQLLYFPTGRMDGSYQWVVRI